MSCNHVYDKDKFWLGCPFCEGGALYTVSDLKKIDINLSKIPCRTCKGSGTGNDWARSHPTAGGWVFGPEETCPDCQGLGGKFVNTQSDEWKQYMLELQVTTDRPSFDDIYMHMAQVIALRSTCSRAKVGALVVSSDNHRVLAVGYNGGPRGIYNACLSTEPGKCGHIHAEINALIKLNYHDAAEKKIYVTSSPCYNCAVAIVNAKIAEVIFKTRYRDESGLRLLEEAKISTKEHVPKDFSAWGL